MPPKRMTANPLRPARYRPGKPTGASEASSSSEAEDEDEEDEDSSSRQQQQQQIPQRSAAPPPKATSFANVDLKARRQAAEQQDLQRRREEAQERERMEREAGFVTESSEEEESGSEEDDGSDSKDSSRITHRPKVVADAKQQAVKKESESESEDESSEDESSSSEEERPVRLRPTFIRKDKRGAAAAVTATPDPVAEAEAKAAAEEQRRQKETEELIKERIERDAAARAAGRKGWDDDEGDEDEIPDDTDGVDAELERTQWVARELGRLKRARAALEEREAEIAEVERRRGLSAAEREREDREYLAEQAEHRKERGKMAPMQKYHHRGAFFGDEARELGLLDRDIMGARFEDQVSGGGGNTAGVPEYLQVRDATMIGRKGRTRYRDLKSEDTGRWGEGFDYDPRGGRGGAGQGRPDYSDVKDERFRPDYGGDARGATGANASALGQKRTGHGDNSERDGKRTRVD